MLKNYYPPRHPEKIFEVYIKVFNKELILGSMEHEVIRKDGSIGFVETTISSITDSDGKVTGFRTIAIDVANRKIIEAALIESEKKYRHFIENANEIIYKTDWRGNFIYSNPACQKMIEYTSEELSHLNYIDIIPAENVKLNSLFTVNS